MLNLSIRPATPVSPVPPVEPAPQEHDLAAANAASSKTESEPGPAPTSANDIVPDGLTASADDASFMAPDPVPTGQLAADTLANLPAALTALLAASPPFQPPQERLTAVTRCLENGGCHRSVVEALHDRVALYLASPCDETSGPIKALLHTPAFADELLKLLCTAAVTKGAPLTPLDQEQIPSAAGGDTPYNGTFRTHAIETLLSFLETGIVPDWPDLLKKVQAVEAAETEAAAADLKRLVEEAYGRPPYFGLPIHETPKFDGPTGSQLSRLPSAEKVLALAREIAPALEQPLRHMMPLSLLPHEIRVLYLPDPEQPPQLLPRIVMSFFDPDRTPVENALAFQVAQALLRPADVEDELLPRPDAAYGTLTFTASAYGSSNDPAIAFHESCGANAFLDKHFLLADIRHNGQNFFLPGHASALVIDQPEDGPVHRIVELAHLAATVYAGKDSKPAMQFALRLQLPGRAESSDTALLESVVGAVVGPAQVCRNGSYTMSIAVAIKAALEDGPGSFVDPQGRPGFRCLESVTRKNLAEFLAWAGLERYFDLEMDMATRCWTALSIGLPAVSQHQCLPLARARDYTPMQSRAAMPAAIAHVQAVAAHANLDGDAELAILMERFARVLENVERAAPAGSDFAPLFAAAIGLAALHVPLAEALLQRLDEDDKRPLLETLERHVVAVAAPVLERAALLRLRQPRSGT
ncbi:hypothetical protein GT347_13630 [Xylophilus rhododendri]|uniref:Uncharacterized protein n=1 Tax=Xylophilus rhododendri TaxID=2697032 RepID=A0A857J823_9BURK|nr:hypothetical protein [Xylophilus rhododendri]QHI98935.1 hypothetical protein GT347_13630 [Xylophilus rhododendri]